MQIQVAYNQGMVKTFLTTEETRINDFVRIARSFGRFRSVRFQPDIDAQQANAMVKAGNATMVEARYAKG